MGADEFHYARESLQLLSNLLLSSVSYDESLFFIQRSSQRIGCLQLIGTFDMRCLFILACPRDINSSLVRVQYMGALCFVIYTALPAHETFWSWWFGRF